jgi:hypothetical protein
MNKPKDIISHSARTYTLVYETPKEIKTMTFDTIQELEQYQKLYNLKTKKIVIFSEPDISTN